MIAITFVCLLCSCTKVVDVNLESEAHQLVIEGNLSDQQEFQYVKLSESVAIANTNTYPAVTGATVSLTDDNNKTYALQETVAGTYTMGEYAGTPGHTYTLQVTTGGKTYTAASSLPQKIWIAALAAKNSTLDNGNNEKEITVSYHDPSVTANHYYFMLYVNGVQVKTVFAFSDQLNDGNYTTVALTQDEVAIYSGDTVIVEMQCIDKAMYTYWHTLMQQDDTNGASVSLADPPNNISPTALGYFSAHTVERQAMIVK